METVGRDFRKLTSNANALSINDHIFLETIRRGICPELISMCYFRGFERDFKEKHADALRMILSDENGHKAGYDKNYLKHVRFQWVIFNVINDHKIMYGSVCSLYEAYKKRQFTTADYMDARFYVAALIEDTTNAGEITEEQVRKLEKGVNCFSAAVMCLMTTLGDELYNQLGQKTGKSFMSIRHDYFFSNTKKTREWG
jgi:hypothetical protein